MFPVAEGECRKLAEIDVVELGRGGDGDDDEECLEVLKEAVSNADELLVEAVVQRLEMTAAAGRGNRNHVKVTAGEQADVQVGQQYSEAVLLANASILMPEGTTNAVDVVVAKGLARVHIGSRFGVRF
jgi:hypothetical protein